MNWLNKTLVPLLTKGPVRWLLIALIAATPTLLGLSLVKIFAGVPISHYAPSYPNDLPDYWHESESFRVHGFATGYYTADERPPQAEFTHYGVHGPIFPAMQGLFGRVFGWDLDGPIWFNLAVVTAALLIFIFLARPDGRQLGFLFVLVLTFWPVHLLTPTAFQESFHHAGAIVLAGLSAAWLRANEKKRKPIFIAIAGVLFFLSVLRFSWALLFTPLFLAPLVMGPKKLQDPKQIAIRVVLSVLPLIVAMKIFGALAAPGHNLITQLFAMAVDQPLGAVFAILGLIGQNISISLMAAPLDLLLRVEILLLSFALPIVLILPRLKGLELNESQRKMFISIRREGLLYSYMAGTIFISSFALYLSAGFYRVFSVVFLLIALLLLVTHRLKAVTAVVALHLLFAPYLYASTQEWRPNFRAPESLQPFRAFFGAKLKYEPPPASPWCNTILMSWQTFDYRVNLIPAGFGISTFSPVAPPQGAFRSRYIMLTLREYQRIQNPSALKSAGVLPDQKLALFENTKSDCR